MIPTTEFSPETEEEEYDLSQRQTNSGSDPTPKTELSPTTVEKQNNLSRRQDALDTRRAKLIEEQEGIKALNATEITENQIARGQEIKRLLFVIQQQDAALLTEQIEFDENFELPEREEIWHYLLEQPEIVKVDICDRCVSIGYIKVDHDDWQSIDGSISPNMLHRHPLHLAALDAAENAKAQTSAVRSRIAENSNRLGMMLEELEKTKAKLLSV